jgi:hypothetical protein
MGRLSQPQSRATTRQMVRRIQETRLANQARKIADEEHRRTDPFEQAKSLLQRRGYHVFGAEILGGPIGMIMVGRELLEPDQVIAKAERVKLQMENSR